MALALPFFAVTLFVSAFLLFLVQPMIGKMILPRLGGTPQVWNTCMMFFQTALLAGYFYTHAVSTKLSLRRQLVVHSFVLLVPLVVLLWNGPFNVTDWTPPPDSNPIWSTLLILTVVVGVPFFVVATTAPLLQKWFAYTGHPAAKDPYFLYGASNLGSLLALFAYPFVVEPLFRLQGPVLPDGAVGFDLAAQSWVWTVGYVVFGLMVVGCAVMVFKSPMTEQPSGAALEEPPPAEFMAAAPPEPVTQIKAAAPVAAPAAQRGSTSIRRGSKQRGRRPGGGGGGPAPSGPSAPTPAQPAQPAILRPFEMTWWKRLRWILLAAVPTSLMLGVTTYISTDISAITMFWVIPLALYLLTFILVFMRWPIVWTDLPHTVMLFLQPIFLLIPIWTMITGRGFHPLWSTLMCLAAFFATALVCHGELAKGRPPTKYLTDFYLCMSLGGMLGGTFNALLAPLLFVGTVEFPLALVMAGLLRSRTGQEPLTERCIGMLAPGLVKSLDEAGDRMARNFKGIPEDAPGARVSRAGLPPRGWLLSGILDIVLPVLLGLVFYWVLTNASDSRSWNWRYIGDTVDSAKENPLFRIWYNTFGMKAPNAASYAQTTYQVLVFGLPLIITFLFFPRPLRFGLGMGAILIFSHMHDASVDRGLLHAGRSYYGVLRVRERAYRDPKTNEMLQGYTYLMHGTTHHGLNYQKPEEVRRLATTYYHRFGPVGVVMEPLNWFPATRESYALPEAEKKKINWSPYHADARLPASVIGSLAGSAALPMGGIVGAWSEPPIATIGLGTGTMASYGRPLQHVVFYEIDEQVRRFSLPEQGDKLYFNYLDEAKKRGAKVEVVMGDARLSMKQENPALTPSFPNRDNYYRVMVVDAFSSDAIPIHLITKEAIEMYFQKLRVGHEEKDKDGNVVLDKDGKPVYHRGGVLCVHTSNRHVDLVQPVTDVAKHLGLKWRVGKDSPPEREDLPANPSNPDLGRFGSEYVMLARDERDLPPNSTREEAEQRRRGGGLEWYTPEAPGNRLWTDDYSNLMGVFRW